MLVIGTTRTTDPKLLPGGLISSSGAPTRETVTLDGAQFYRYLGLTVKGAHGNVYALPTKIGTVLAACMLQDGGALFAADCERVIGTLALTPGSVLGLGPSPSVADGLKDAVSKLDGEIGKDGAQLGKAKKPGAQARASDALASAYQQAGSSILQLATPPAATAAVTALANALQTTGTHYAALATAARTNNDGKYNTARRSIDSAGGTVGAAFARLARLGYTAR